MQTTHTLFSTIDIIKVSLWRFFGIKTTYPETDSVRKNIAGNAPADWYEQTHGTTNRVVADQEEAG